MALTTAVRARRERCRRECQRIWSNETRIRSRLSQGKPQPRSILMGQARSFHCTEVLVRVAPSSEADRKSRKERLVVLLQDKDLLTFQADFFVCMESIVVGDE
jgi:hypothetical protein